MTDIRIDVGFFSHAKTKRLKRALGLEGVHALLMFWAYAGQNMYDSEKVYSADEIELAVDWDGEPGSLVDTLVAVGFLDDAAGGFAIHEWNIHNGYAATAAKRSEAARIAANKRWQTTRYGKEKALTTAPECGSDTDALPIASLGNAPSPSQFPKKEINRYVVSESPKTNPATKKRHDYSQEYEAFFAVYPARNGQKNGKHAGQKAFHRALRAKGVTPEFLTDRIRQLSTQYGEYPPDIATWLNQCRWEDPVARPANDFERDLAAMREAAAKRGLQ